jgi:hypothetical protein
MRDKIVIKGKYAIKTTKRPPVQEKEKEKEKGETIEKIRLETEV